MKINFDKILKDFEGKPIPAADGKSAVLRGIVIDALLATYKDEQNLTGEEKLKRYLLAEKVHKKEDDLAIEEIASLKKLIGKAFAPLIVGQAWQILEGKDDGFKE
jgi:hypothetical protein